MSQAKPIRTMSLDTFDAAIIALDRAIGMLHCVHTTIDPENHNRPSPELVANALDGATATVEHVRYLMGVVDAQPGSVVDFPAAGRH